jgi:hypothetical protein
MQSIVNQAKSTLWATPKNFFKKNWNFLKKSVDI